MVKLAGKILLIALLALACNLAINKLFFNKAMPAIRGDKQLLGKFNTLAANNKIYNTIFIGSSKTHYHIAPHVFDSVVNAQTRGHIKSYNFGIDGMLPMESFHVCRELLQSPKVKISTLIFELVFPKTNDTENIFTYRGFYWVDASGYANYTTVLMGSGLSKASKLKNLGYISLMRAENWLNLGKLNEYTDYLGNPNYTDADEPNAGFEGLQVNKLTAADDALVDATRAASNQAFQNLNAWSNRLPNQAYLQQIEQLNQLAKQRNVRVIYVMPMLWGHTWQYQQLFPIYRRLPNSDNIILADADNFPYHFQKDSLFDAVHLSKQQAIQYTKAVADAFVKKGLIK